MVELGTSLHGWMFLNFLNTPPWSSDRDPQRRFPRLQTFRPFESPDVFGGGGRIRWSAGCPCRFFFILRSPTLTAGYERLSLAFLCRSLLPGLERLPKALNGFFMSHTTCFWLAIFDYARFSLAFLCRSHPPQLPTAVMKALSGFFTQCT